jgi:hypothetical protein
MGSRCAARRRSHRKWPAASELAVGHVWAREGDNLAGTSTPHRDAIAGITCTHLSSLSCEAISAINKTRSERNQSSPAIRCKTLFNVYTICMHQIKFYTFGEILRSDVQARIS